MQGLKIIEKAGQEDVEQLPPPEAYGHYAQTRDAAWSGDENDPASFYYPSGE